MNVSVIVNAIITRHSHPHLMAKRCKNEKTTLGKIIVAVLFTVIMLKMLFVPGPISIGTLIALGMGILVSLGFSLPKFGKTHK